MRAELRNNWSVLVRRATGGKWRRWLYRPLGYPAALLHRLLLYRRSKAPLRRTATTFFGASMRLLLPSGSDIYFTGGKAHDSELRLARYLIESLEAGDTVIDVGAHYGYYSLLAAHLVGPTGRVVAFEAAPATFAILRENTGVRPVLEAHQLAVAERVGEVSFYEFSNRYAEYNSLLPAQFGGRDWYADNTPVERSVPAVTLDGFCGEHGLRPQTVKIDVEGAEDRVVAGMQALLRARRATIIMEYLSAGRDNGAHRAAAAALERAGYRPHRIGGEGQLRIVTNVEDYLEQAALDSDNIVYVCDRCV